MQPKSAARVLLGLIKQAAADSVSNFNESVPASEKPETGMVDQYGNPIQDPKDKNSQQSAEMNAGDNGEEIAAEPQQEEPASVGPMAAQQFLGPEIMQAAAQGDPVAIDIVARTAGQVAAAMEEAAARQSQAPQGGAAGGVMPMPGQDQAAMTGAGGIAPPAITTPEEDLANEIAGNPQQPATATPGNPNQPADGSAPGTNAPANEAASGDEQQGQKDKGKADNTKVIPGSPEGEKKAKNPFDKKDKEGGKEEGGDKKPEVSGSDEEIIAKLIRLAKSGKI